MRRTHRLLTIALTLALGALAVPAWAGNGANLLPLLPGSADAVVGVNLEQLRGTSLYQRAIAMAEGQDDVQEALGDLRSDDFDPVTAARTVVVASDDVSDDAGERMIVLIEADYPAESLATRLGTDGFEQSELHGVAVYRKSQSTVAMLSPTLLAVGHYDFVSAAIGAHTGNGSAGLSGNVASQASAVDKGGALWFVAALPDNPQGAERVRGTISLSSGFSLSAVVGMETAEQAATSATEFTTQRDALAGQPEVAGLGLTPVLTGLAVTANDTDLTVALSLDATTWDAIVTTMSQLIEEELR